MLGTTFGGNHLACAASLAVLEVIESEQLIKKAAQTGILLKKELESINEVKEVRGRGLMLGVEFDFPVDEIRKKMLYEQHVFTGSSSNKNTLRLLPPLNISEKEVHLCIKALKNVLT